MGNSGNRSEINVSDAAYQIWACKYIDEQVRILKRKVRGARLARDIEHIHQARVASRRLRTALTIFTDCFAESKCDKWRREIRRLTRRLGAARDADVQLGFLRKFISGLPHKSKKYKHGLRRLMLRLKQRRQAIQPKVVRVLDRLEKKQVLDEIIADVQEITAHRNGRSLKLQSQFAFQKARENITDRLTELFSFEHCLNDPNDGAGHHQMRIAAKHLRYTLEICNLPFEEKLDDFIKGIKRLQSLLGELHDNDVWLDNIRQFSVDEKTRMIEFLGSARAFKRLKRGTDYFVRQIRKDRKELYEQSLQYWKRLGEDGFWNKLDTILKTEDAGQGADGAK